MLNYNEIHYYLYKKPQYRDNEWIRPLDRKFIRICINKNKRIMEVLENKDKLEIQEGYYINVINWMWVAWNEY